MADIILGIDPGIHGGMAFLWPNANLSLSVDDLPIAGGELNLPALAEAIASMAPRVAVVERVHAMPKQGVSSTFRFGEACGGIRGILAALKIPVHLVTPGSWKKYYGLNAEKDEARKLALRLWPENAADMKRVKDHGRAEAALIARWGALKGL